MLVGNKKEYRIDPNGLELPVKMPYIDAVVDMIGAYAYLECSAKYNEGVWEVFETAIQATMPKKWKQYTVL